MNEWFQTTYDSINSDPAGRWLIAFVASLAITVLAKLILTVVSNRVRRFTSRTVSTWDDMAVDIIDGLKAFVIFAWVFYIASASLNPTETLKKILLIAVVVASIVQITIWGLYLLRNWHEKILRKRIQHDPSSAAALGLLFTAAQVGFLTVVLLIGLSNLGINVSALITGLGVGGIAIALAAQNVLGDLFASLSIVLDKPFVVGDFIVAGNEKGTVEQIGLKTTRIRSLSGEELVLANKDLLESRVQNFKRMLRRRVVQGFGVLYSTPPEVLQEIPDWVKSIVLKNEKVTFDRCHLARYGASSLDFEFVFFVEDPEYNTYMDLQQTILLDIIRKFSSANVGFAFPTQTLHIESLPPSDKIS